VTRVDFRDGMIRFLFGLAKKVLLADHIGHLAAEIFRLPVQQLDMWTAWIGILCFTAQIYFDFSGYSDMAEPDFRLSAEGKFSPALYRRELHGLLAPMANKLVKPFLAHKLLAHRCADRSQQFAHPHQMVAIVLH
jgi:hypothetical protein